MHTVLNDHFVSRQHNGEGGVVSIFFSWSWAIHVHNFRLVVIFLRSIRLVFFFHVVIIRFNHDYRFPRSSTPSQRNIASSNALSALVPCLGFLFSRFCSPAGLPACLQIDGRLRFGTRSQYHSSPELRSFSRSTVIPTNRNLE